MEPKNPVYYFDENDYLVEVDLEMLGGKNV